MDYQNFHTMYVSYDNDIRVSFISYDVISYLFFYYLVFQASELAVSSSIQTFTESCLDLWIPFLSV